jgi:uncharacterized protein involved in propanediol utilization
MQTVTKFSATTRTEFWTALAEPEPQPAPRIGVGESTAHHGELFQGQIEDQENRKRRCLVTLPCPCLRSKAVFHPQRGGQIQVHPGHKQKARRVVELALATLQKQDLGGVLVIESNIAEGKGYGSSTADCVAAVHAVADALGVFVREQRVAQLVVEAEVASDNIMFRSAVLFAQREGVVLENYATPLPPLEVLGVDCDADGFVDTLRYAPAAYSWREIQQFQTLVGGLRRAIRTNDAQLLGCVATASAEINERYLPKRFFRELKQLANAVGALGVSAAHSGTLMSFLLHPRDPQLRHKIHCLREGLCRIGISECFHFQSWNTQMEVDL